MINKENRESVVHEIKAIGRVRERLKWIKSVTIDKDMDEERNALPDAIGAVVADDIAELESISINLNCLLGLDEGGAACVI